jgi:hypothetical protein
MGILHMVIICGELHREPERLVLASTLGRLQTDGTASDFGLTYAFHEPRRIQVHLVARVIIIPSRIFSAFGNMPNRRESIQ